MLVAHFAGDAAGEPCTRCDVCTGATSDAAEPARAAPARAPEGEPLPAEAIALVIRAVGQLTRPVGKTNLARALRGSRARALARGGLLAIAEHGALAAYGEAQIAAAIDALVGEGRLRRTGKKYPTVWLAGRPVRPPRAARTDGERSSARARSSRWGGPIARALDSYRRRQARALRWKTYMVFQHKVLLAIDREQPETRAALAKIPGLGPAKLERFGDDILELVRQHRTPQASRSEPKASEGQ